MREDNKNRKEEILSHQTEVDIDGIWAAIEPQVDAINAGKKRKRRFIFLFWFGALLLGTAGIYTWQSDFFRGQKDIVIEDISTLENVKNGTLILEDEEECEELLNGNVLSKSADNEQFKGSGLVAANEKIVKKAAFSPKQTNKSEQTFIQENTIVNTTNISSTINENTTLEIEVPRRREESALVAEDDYLIKEGLPKLSRQLSKAIEKTIPPLDITLLEEEELPGGKLNFSLGVNAGVSFIGRDLTPNLSTESNLAVLSLRRTSETPLEAQHYNINGKLTHKSGFSVTTGAQYTLMTERYDNNRTEVTQDSIEGVVKRTIQLNGDTLDVQGYVPRTTTREFEKEIFNRYRMVDIPVLVGFEGGKNEWSFGVQAGVFVNLSLQTSGKVISNLEEDLDIGANQSSIFKDKVGLSYYGGLYIRREISPYLDVTIAPHARFFGDKFTVDEYVLSQRYKLFGVQAGLSYRFGG